MEQRHYEYTGGGTLGLSHRHNTEVVFSPFVEVEVPHFKIEEIMGSLVSPEQVYGYYSSRFRSEMQNLYSSLLTDFHLIPKPIVAGDSSL